MNEGWSESDYLAVCESDDEIQRLTVAYEVGSRLPGFRFVGMKGWDDLVVSNSSGQLFTVPAVPMTSEHLAPAQALASITALRVDPKLRGKVKWYRTPLVFGGSSTDGSNLLWISHDEHQRAVREWNRIYDDLKGKTRK